MILPLFKMKDVHQIYFFILVSSLYYQHSRADFSLNEILHKLKLQRIWLIFQNFSGYTSDI